ncbi:MAG: hypothetical protein QF752_02655 [Planctomycetota bacterium]|nr:hypothetical protein [Planctomycetota bacterium]
MEQEDRDRYDTLKVGTEEMELTIVTEPFVVFTHRGYTPVINVEDKGGDRFTFFISSSSVARELQPLIDDRGGRFKDLKILVKKESEEKFAKYQVARAEPIMIPKPKAEESSSEESS